MSDVVIKTDAAGNSVVVIRDKEMSTHAAEQATIRNVSNDEISAAFDREPFDYVQNGEVLQGYYYPSTNVFIDVGDRITTLIKPKKPENYIQNLKDRQ